MNRRERGFETNNSPSSKLIFDESAIISLYLHDIASASPKAFEPQRKKYLAALKKFRAEKNPQPPKS